MRMRCSMNNLRLRDYQQEAVEAFIDSSFKGLFEMATGTGKTITALKCIDSHYKANNRQFLVIIVPFVHLIDQWVKDFSKIDLMTHITVAYSRDKWYSDLKSSIWEYNRGFRNRVVVIGSYKSMASNDFQSLIRTVDGDRMLVSDECHYLGSPSYKQTAFSSFESALGLSATPRRWWDEAGTSRIYQIFERVIYSYSMEKAIKNQYLSPYYYYPKLISLTEEELEKYEIYSRKIGQLMGSNQLSMEKKETLKRLLRRRARVIQSASNKLPALLKLLQQQKDKRFTLVYCSPGELNTVIKQIADLNIKVHRFNSELYINERKGVLDLFQKGEIDVLVAIKCLDEGVDIPATRNAYFLASTSNPREFVQRRGRILRLSEGKSYSTIYDFITLQDHLPANTFNSLVNRELPRYAEFANSALNKYQERDHIRSLLSHYDLEMYLNITPWQMYDLSKKENGGNYETTGEHQ